MSGKAQFNTTAHQAAQTFRAQSGQSHFAYSDNAHRTGNWTPHEVLDPKKAAKREAFDSAEFPESTPVAVLFDVTGSMGDVPKVVQAKLPDLMGLLGRNGYCSDPQIMVGAIGDVRTDHVPFQVGQFETDNRIDDQIRNIILEGHGGGQKSESYQVGAWFMLRRVVTDNWNKRGRKGYLFIIGDEMNDPRGVQRRHLEEVFGGEGSYEDMSNEEVYAKLEERWNVFFILPNLTNYYDDRQVNEHWRKLLGERFLKLEDPEAVAELIAATVGMMEDAVNLDNVVSDLKAIGTGKEAVVSRTLATVGATNGTGRTVANVGLPDDLND